MLAAAFTITSITNATAEETRATKSADKTQAFVDSASRAWFASEWQAFVTRFVTADGRVVDNGNGGVSHSEGQGYGLLLAAKAGDAPRFDAIWHWTRTTLLIRKDGLAAWKWDPVSRKVADTNNATDGDVLIAWGLAEGAKRFGRPDYREAAAILAQSIGDHALGSAKVGPVLLPGAHGFGAGEQPDGPVVNLSYWVFPAFMALGELAPSVDWARIRRSGLAMLEQSRFGTFGLPTEWESLAGPHPRPAARFPIGFGYNAIRIPLYLAMDGSIEARAALRRFAGRLSNDTAGVKPKAGQLPITAPIDQPGYDLVLAVARCIAKGEVIPPEMIKTRSELYYPETLRLFSVIAIQERFSACL